MKISHFASVPVALIGTLMVGCLSPRAARIRENAAVFAALDPVTQKVIEEGLFDYGFTSELVYMSLGRPNHSATADTAEGTLVTWTYRNFLYASSGAVKFGINNPGTRAAQAPILSSSAPGGPSLSSTKSGPVQPTLPDVNDVPIGTLFIYLLNGRVVAAHLKP